MKWILVLILLLTQTVGNASAGMPHVVGSAAVQTLIFAPRVATIVVAPEEAAKLFEQGMHRAEGKSKNPRYLCRGLGDSQTMISSMDMVKSRCFQLQTL